MKSLLIAIAMLLPIASHGAEAKDDPRTKGAPEDTDSRSRDVRLSVESERAQIKPLVVQEQAELEAIKNNKTLSPANKRSAIKKIKKDYIERRNAIHVKARAALRSKLSKATE